MAVFVSVNHLLGNQPCKPTQPSHPSMGKFTNTNTNKFTNTDSIQDRFPMWNSLPAGLQTATLSPLTFARHLKTHLFGWSTARQFMMRSTNLLIIIIIQGEFPQRVRVLGGELGTQIGRCKLLEYRSYRRFSWSNSSHCLVRTKCQHCTDAIIINKCTRETTCMAHSNHE